MYRIVRFGLDDIALDQQTVAASLSRVCRRTHHRVTGLCQTAHEVIFALEPAPDAGPVSYVLAPFDSDAPDDLVADIWSRWGAGFSTRGMIRLSASCLGLFEHAGGDRRRPVRDDDAPAA